MVSCSVSELKSLKPLAEVPEDQLQWLLEAGQCKQLAVGDLMFDIGDTFTSANFILDGKFSVSLQQGNQVNEVLITERGDINGYLPFSRGIISIIRIVCIEPALILMVPTAEIDKATKLHYELTKALVHQMLSRVRFATAQEQQIEKMFALGKLSAGLAHELNNPAAAIGRNAATLVSLFRDIPNLFQQTLEIRLEPAQLAPVKEILKAVLSREKNAVMGMMERSDLEDDITNWLDAHHIDDYTLAEILVHEGFTIDDLETLKSIPPVESLNLLFKWLSYHLATGKIAAEIEEAAGRISELVGAVKNFSHMDRGGDKQAINIVTGLESTLTMLNHKVKSGHITVIREFAADLPPAQAFAGELNQVWTNIIDNAIDAMSINATGQLKITTKVERNNIVVVINDNGPGIPAEIASKIFDPFFTTKEIGKGTGLGLDVVTRIIKQHRGAINLKSTPGDTSFIICIPINDK